MAWNGSDGSEAGVRRKDGASRKRKAIVGLVAASAVTTSIVLGVWIRRCGAGDHVGPTPVSAVSANDQKHLTRMVMSNALAKANLSGRTNRTHAVKKPINRPVEWTETFSGEDLKISQALQEALDNDDFETTRAAALKALKSSNPQLRMNAVEALSWFGIKALPELTACMADADEDVRQAAQNAWEMGVQDIEDPAARFKIVSSAMEVLNDSEQLDSLESILSGAASEMIDGSDDEAVTAQQRVAVVQALCGIIEGGNAAAAESAKEAYQDVTGNEWRSVAEAELYLKDPDNYELPEDRAEAAAVNAE